MEPQSFRRKYESGQHQLDCAEWEAMAATNRLQQRIGLKVTGNQSYQDVLSSVMEVLIKSSTSGSPAEEAATKLTSTNSSSFGTSLGTGNDSLVSEAPSSGIVATIASVFNNVTSTSTVASDFTSLFKAALTESKLGLNLERAIDNSERIIQTGFQYTADEISKLKQELASSTPNGNPYKLEALDEKWQSFLIALYSFTALSSFILNVITVIVLLRCRRSELREYLINLSLSDLLMSLFSIPFTYTEYMLGRWIFSAFLCPLVRFVVTLSVFVSAATMTVIGVNRHLAIMDPFGRSSLSRLKNLRVSKNHVVVFIWLIGTLVSLPEFLMFTLIPFCHEGSIYWTCGLIYDNSFESSYAIFIYICTFAIPLSLLSYLYGCIMLKLWRRRLPGEADVSRDLVMHQMRMKTIKMLCVVVIMFAISWLPMQTFSMVVNLFPSVRQVPDYNSLNYNLFVWTFFVCHWLSMAHSCLNPLIYCFMNDKFLSDLRELVVFRSSNGKASSSQQQSNGGLNGVTVNSILKRHQVITSHSTHINKITSCVSQVDKGAKCVDKTIDEDADSGEQGPVLKSELAKAQLWVHSAPESAMDSSSQMRPRVTRRRSQPEPGAARYKVSLNDKIGTICEDSGARSFHDNLYLASNCTTCSKDRLMALVTAADTQSAASSISVTTTCCLGGGGGGGTSNHSTNRPETRQQAHIEKEMRGRQPIGAGKSSERDHLSSYSSTSTRNAADDIEMAAQCALDDYEEEFVLDRQSADQV